MKNNLFMTHDSKSLFFLKSLEERFSKILGMDNKQSKIKFKLSNYVIPGVLIKVKNENCSVPVWVGVNGGRIFFIIRLKCSPKRAKKAMKFAFGGASKLGWSFLYEKCNEKETSVWGTLENQKKFVKKSSDNSLRLTRNGFFWSNDVAMMMQSVFRTIEREKIKVSQKNPEPL